MFCIKSAPNPPFFSRSFRRCCPSHPAAVAPVGPVAPAAPAGPVGPVAPVAPVGPVGPVGPPGPVGPMDRAPRQRRPHWPHTGIPRKSPTARPDSTRPTPTAWAHTRRCRGAPAAKVPDQGADRGPVRGADRGAGSSRRAASTAGPAGQNRCIGNASFCFLSPPTGRDGLGRAEHPQPTLCPAAGLRPPLPGQKSCSAGRKMVV